MLRLYDARLSGNCWKVRLLLTQLGLPFERVTLDIAKGETAEAGFGTISRFSRVPALALPDGRTLVESGAILLYLAEGSRFLPTDPLLRAEVISWLFFEQGDLQRPLAGARVHHLRGTAERCADEVRQLQAAGYTALDKLERWLAPRNWLVGDDYTLADLAVFPYVSMAREGGYDMDRFPAIGRWVERVRAQPGFVGLFEPGTAVAAAGPGAPGAAP